MTTHYDYIIDKIKTLFPDKTPTVLEFGCGEGPIVSKGLQAGFDIWGADTFHDIISATHREGLIDDPAVKERLKKIEDGILPFPENHFDVVISNMVFEHIDDLEQPLAEIERVLKPGGLLLALFPTRETWWEGHCHLLFAHLLAPGSQWQHRYLRAMRHIGLGFEGTVSDKDEWAEKMQLFLTDYCFYHRMKKVKAWWAHRFNDLPQEWEDDYMLYRIRHSGRVSKLATFFDHAPGRFLLKHLCIRRACRVLAIRKQNPRGEALQDAA